METGPGAGNKMVKHIDVTNNEGKWAAVYGGEILVTGDSPESVRKKMKKKDFNKDFGVVVLPNPKNPMIV
ncbi:hypothetical protein AKJ36_03255 [candidate division MSBL1 archaeon SCGC-AAA259I07]|uniref:Uncharacterized protein n=1 Tax=candidate division MSBL1 archaeon SCGC-AAA259I07 TaxID=1698266 RepID=A0A133UJ93_9EURY|nr:hypothetical protein AKJ36_03255 [candidate division MSBL1 archaeon SCGC-AAA259I07]